MRFFEHTTLLHKRLYDKAERDDTILQLTQDAVVLLKAIKLFVELRGDEGLLCFLGFLLRFGANARVGLRYLDQCEKKVRVIHPCYCEIHAVVDHLAHKQISGVGLHLLEVLVVLSRGHNSGHVHAAIVSVLLHALASNHIKCEHIKMAL